MFHPEVSGKLFMIVREEIVMGQVMPSSSSFSSSVVRKEGASTSSSTSPALLVASRL
jgi:hypothetical protein